MNALKIAAAALFALTAANPLQASEGPWRVGGAYVVPTDSLDLSSPEGRERLLEAIETAARRACAPQVSAVRRAACEDRTIEATINKSSSQVQDAVAQARSERG